MELCPTFPPFHFSTLPLPHSPRAFESQTPQRELLSLGLLRPLRGSAYGLGQPDAFGAGESLGVLEFWSVWDLAV